MTDPMEAKPPADSHQILRVPVFPRAINELGHAKAGEVLKLIDIAGWVSPMKHIGPGGVVVTASLDRTNFTHPVRRWEILQLDSRVTQVWSSSLEVQVSVSTENMRTGERRNVATAYQVLVSLDAKLKKAPVPPLRLDTEEDRRLAQAADIRKAHRLAEGKQAPFQHIDPEADQPVTFERLMTPEDANGFNNVFGGVILEIINEAASLAAKRQFLGGTVVGVRQDRMSFLQPAFIGEVIIASAIVTKTWLSSMEIQVEVEARNPQTGLSRPIGSSYLVYVAVDPEGVPVQVPPWHPQTPIQQQRSEAAEYRRQIYKAEAAQTQ